MKKTGKRLFALALAAVLSVTMPGAVSYVRAENEKEASDNETAADKSEASEESKGEENCRQVTGICVHHTEHTSDCGYREAQSCTHECGPDCFRIMVNCVHTHGPDCYMEITQTDGSGAENGEDASGGGDTPGEENTSGEEDGSGENNACGGGERRIVENCSHVCTKESGCIWQEAECSHVHGENCGYAEATECAYICEICVEEEDADKETENPDGDLNENPEENPDEENADGEEDFTVKETGSFNKLMTKSSEQTENSVAGVTADGVTEYYESIVDAWNAAQGKTAEIRILKDVDLERKELEINDAASNITLEMEDGVTLSGKCGGKRSFMNVLAGSLTMKSGRILNTNNLQGHGVDVKTGGRFILENGTIEMTGTDRGNVGIKVEDGTVIIRGGKVSAYSYALSPRRSKVTITGGEFTTSDEIGRAILTGSTDILIEGGYFKSVYAVDAGSGNIEIRGGIFEGSSGALFAQWSGGNYRISGGTFYGKSYTLKNDVSNGQVKAWLEDGCAYYDVDSNSILNPGTSWYLKGNVRVDICTHSFSDWEPDQTGSHVRTCKGCGLEEKEDCSYEYTDITGESASGKEGQHSAVCTVCGYQKGGEPHTFSEWALSGDSTYVRFCTACKREHRAEITRPFAGAEAAYGETGQQFSVQVTGAEASFAWKRQGEDTVLSTESSYTLSDKPPVGNYVYECAVTLEGDSAPVDTFSFSLKVNPAGLEGGAVTVEEGDGIFYDGKEKEPDVTVTVNGKTLVRGTDYTVSYSGNVSVGEGTAVITGINNYEGTLSRTFPVRYFETNEAAAAPKEWCSSAKITAPSGFTLSASLDGTFGAEIFYEKETGPDGADVTYYLKQDTTGYITGAKTVRVKVDITLPAVDGTGNGIKITDRDVWWQKLLTAVSFGHYKPQQVTVHAEDALSGIDKVYYYIDRKPGEKPLSADELRGLSAGDWTASDMTSFPLDEEGRYVIYAYAQDKAGNRSAYICSDGIVIDSTAPVLTLTAPAGEGLKDTGAAPLAKMNESGNITYLLSETEKSGITASDILNSADSVKRSVTGGQAGTDLELHLTGLKANTVYYVYAVGTDTAGNVGEVEQVSFTTLKTAVAGTVSIEGKAVYGETLTALASVGTANAGAVSYQWYRQDAAGNRTPIPGANSVSYRLTAEDVGCKIGVEVTAENCSGKLDATAGDKVQKADCPAVNAPVNGRVNDEPGTDSFTFTGKKDVVYEYSLDGGSTWKEMESAAFSPDAQDNTKVTGTLAIGNYAYEAGQVQVRAKATESFLASGAVKNDAAFTAYLEGSAALTGTAKYGETLTAAVTGAQPGVPLVYSFYREGETAPVQTGSGAVYTLKEADIGKKISVKVTAAGYEGALEDETPGAVAKADGREIPGNVAGSYITDGKTYSYTVNAVAGAQYRMDDGPWQNSNEFTGITPGKAHTFYARMPETDCYEEGSAKGTGQIAFPKITPPAPALQYRIEKKENGTVTVTIEEADGTEYSFDGGASWSSAEGANVKEFSSADTITLAVRRQATATHNQSPEAKAEVNLAKGQQAAPGDFQLIYEADGEKGYFVTIPATEGCEYSFDGINWQDDNVGYGAAGEVAAGYKRYKETGDKNAGSVSSATTALPRFRVKTPSVYPAGGSYAGGTALTVTITCETAGTEIYYTTDGSEPTMLSQRYRGEFAVAVPAIVKAFAVKAGMTDSLAASVSYTKTGSTGGGTGDGTGDGSGSGGGSEDGSGSGGDNGSGSDSGGSGGSGNSSGSEGGTGSGSGSRADNPGNKAGSGSGNLKNGAGASLGRQTAKNSAGSHIAGGEKAGSRDLFGNSAFRRQPFIKPADGTALVTKTGWEIIKSEAEDAPEGDLINVDMNGEVVVPGEVLNVLSGRDITIAFYMGNGMVWRVNGRSFKADKIGDIDFSAETEAGKIPEDLSTVPGSLYQDLREKPGSVDGSIYLKLLHQGEFGFTAVLSLDAGKENAGLTAVLIYLGQGEEEPEFVCDCGIMADGTVEFLFTRGGNYVVVVGGVSTDSDSGSSGEEGKQLKKDGNGGDAGSPGNGSAEVKGRNGLKTFLAVLAGGSVLVLAGSMTVIRKKRREEEK